MMDLNVSLNTCVSALLYLQQEVRRAHWNIKGPSFYSLHTLLGDMKGEIEDLHDSIAERTVGLGYEVIGTPIEASIPSSQLNLFPEAQTISRLLDIYRGTQAILKGAVESDSIDYITIDVITTVANALATHEYKLLGHWIK
jgi:starvation-inducible DNA-binding protein